MEEAAARVAQDNCELACCFIQKTAVEKAGPEMDKRLATVSGYGLITILALGCCSCLYSVHNFCLMADCCTFTHSLL